MSDNSAIEWTDTTWNPVVGCAKVSPGCKNCYAETMAARHVLMSRALKRESPYLPVVDAERRRWNGRAVTLPARLAEPLSWKKPRRVFVNSMSDLFHDDVPFEFIAAVFGVMAATPRHTYQVLTKRPARMLEWFAWLNQHGHERRPPPTGDFRPFDDGARARHVWVDLAEHTIATTASWPLSNVWLGVSTENQATADERIPLLLQAPAAVRFISAEPLLEPIDLRRVGPMREGNSNGVDWIIIGGESGPGARRCELGWISSLIQQCEAAHVACFVKQLGAWPALDWLTDVKIADRKGGNPDEWPSNFRVRQFPEVTR